MVEESSARQGSFFEKTAEGPFAGIVFNRPLDNVFTYRVPESLRARLRPGQRVIVPLGRGNAPATGYCVRIDDETGPDADPARIKEVSEILDDPPLIDQAMLELTRWLSGYYACSWGQALDAVVPAGVKKQAGMKFERFLVVPDETFLIRDTLKLPAKQAEALEVLCRSNEPLTVADVRRLAKCASGPVLALKKRGLIHSIRKRVNKPVETDPAEPAFNPGAVARPILTAEQADVLDALSPALEADAFAPFLLHGVTGSGKTEVYLGAIERVVARGREAVVLVPEISLTPQTIRRFRRRFRKVAVLHSHLGDVERRRHWRAIAAGEIEVVVGARSAVFAPTRKLGLIVIDEEHEHTFKQESVPRYHARDVAVKRAQLSGVPIILGSATPALETWRNAELGRYTKLSLPRRVADRPLPEVGLIDLRAEKPQRGKPFGALGSGLIAAIETALEDDGQVMLLLNRRGFHTFILCPRCGGVVKCRACDVALTFHKERRLAICHMCDFEREPPQTCPACAGTCLHYGGVGTERLEREVKATFADRVVRRMDSDTMRSPGSHERVLESFRNGQIDILLGTQMIAKGLDFPNVTLVGVVNADTSLHLPDFRAEERTFQLVAQVAGRTGRGDRPGKVLVQTYSPDHPAIVSAARHDYEGFAALELPRRRAAGVPPYGRLARLIARGPRETEVEAFLNEVAQLFLDAAPPTVRVLGPAPAPVLKIRHLFRFHLQLRASGHAPLQTLLKTVLPRIPSRSGVELAVDVDPTGML